jgi:hypothetical protein
MNQISTSEVKRHRAQLVLGWGDRPGCPQGAVSFRTVTNTRVAAFNLASDQQLTLVRKKDTTVNSTNSILHTEQVVNTKRAVTNKRVAAFNVTSEQHLTLHRDTIIRERLATLEARVAALEYTLA